MKKYLFLITLSAIFSCKNDKTITAVDSNIEDILEDVNVKVIPINHGTLVLETENEVIYVDPTGGEEAFKGQKEPTLVLITDIHGDHLNLDTLNALNLENVTLIGPKAVTDKLPSTIGKIVVTLNNGKGYKFNNIDIEAIPMYNLREDALKFHAKGRGNGYVLTVNNERIYISGDTEDIPEMRNLEQIDKAFVCMNLPYTMHIESAASAVLEFKPKVVYPYHYRGTEGLSDIKAFKQLVNDANSSIDVQLLDWYK